MPATCGKCHEGWCGATWPACTARRSARDGRTRRSASTATPRTGSSAPTARRGRRRCCRVRLVPPGVDSHLPRHVPRSGDAARVHARRDLRRLPRRARHLRPADRASTVSRRVALDLPEVPRRATASFAKYDPHADRHNRARKRDPLLHGEVHEGAAHRRVRVLRDSHALWASRVGEARRAHERHRRGAGTVRQVADEPTPSAPAGAVQYRRFDRTRPAPARRADVQLPGLAFTGMPLLFSDAAVGAGARARRRRRPGGRHHPPGLRGRCSGRLLRPPRLAARCTGSS